MDDRVASLSAIDEMNGRTAVINPSCMQGAAAVLGGLVLHLAEPIMDLDMSMRCHFVSPVGSPWYRRGPASCLWVPTPSGCQAGPRCLGLYLTFPPEHD